MIDVACGVLRRAGCILIAERSKGDLKGRWELPGGKLEPGETPAQAIAREWTEEIGVTPQAGRVLFSLPGHAPKIPPHTLHFIECLTSDPIPSMGREGQRLVWVQYEDIDLFDLLPQDRLVLKKLLA